jgi:hypothetical protein
VFHINIVYFGLGQGKDYVYHGRNDFYGIHRHDLLQLSETQRELYRKTTAGDLFPEYYILRVNDFNDVAKDSLDEWIYYLKNDAIPDGFTAPGLAVAREKLNYDNLSDEEKRDYDHHRKQLSHEKSVIATSRDEGINMGLKMGEEKREELEKELDEKNKVLKKKDKILEEKDKVLEGKDREIAELKRLLDNH